MKVYIPTKAGFRNVSGYILIKNLSPLRTQTDKNSGKEYYQYEDLPRMVVAYTSDYGLKLRERADPQGPPIADCANSTPVVVLGKRGQWLHVIIADTDVYNLHNWVFTLLR